MIIFYLNSKNKFYGLLKIKPGWKNLKRLNLKRFLNHSICIDKEMKFCPNCKTKLTLKQDKQKKKLTVEYVCTRCGYQARNSEDPLSLDNTESISKETVVVISETEEKLRTMPTNKVPCPKCDNDLAYVWQVQTRSGDEGPTQFFRCTKCAHTWRLYT